MLKSIFSTQLVFLVSTCHFYPTDLSSVLWMTLLVLLWALFSQKFTSKVWFWDVQIIKWILKHNNYTISIQINNPVYNFIIKYVNQRNDYVWSYKQGTGNEIFTTCPIMSLFLMPHEKVESCMGCVRWWHFTFFLSPLGQETTFVSKINRSSWIQFPSNECFSKIWDESCPEGKANHRPYTGHRCVTVDMNGEH